jgi:hypothetical protein
MDSILPSFNNDGVLPAGDYLLTLDELRECHLVTGKGNPSNSWDSAWRRELVEGLTIMVEQLRAVGVTEIFVNGSFVQNKDHPGDIDGYFVADLKALASGQLEADLNRLSSDGIWTWEWEDRWMESGMTKPQLPMWHKYRVELFPFVPGTGCGIVDRYGHELDFPSAFRQTREELPKGIIQLR